MIHFYKPNAKVTGTACSFYLNYRDNSFLSTLMKQASWDSSKKIGRFHKDKPEFKVNVKYSPKEIAGFINSIEKNEECNGYHGSNQIVKYKFAPYLRDNKQIGFSYLVTKESKEDSTNKVSFIIGFDYAETLQLREHLKFLLHESFKITDASHQASVTKKSFVNEEPPPPSVSEDQVEDDDLW